MVNSDWQTSASATSFEGRRGGQFISNNCFAWSPLVAGTAAATAAAAAKKSGGEVEKNGQRGGLKK